MSAEGQVPVLVTPQTFRVGPGFGTYKRILSRHRTYTRGFQVHTVWIRDYVVTTLRPRLPSTNPVLPRWSTFPITTMTPSPRE